MRGYYGLFLWSCKYGNWGPNRTQYKREKMYNMSTSEIYEIETTANVLRQMWEKQT